jgi:hypothetical protein
MVGEAASPVGRMTGRRVSPYRQLFEAELERHGLSWCRGCRIRRSHDNGGAFATEGVVHYNREIATRATLQIGLHEIAHTVLGHFAKRRRIRSFEREAEADEWSFARMRALGIDVPERSLQRSARYIAHKKLMGDRAIARRLPRRRARDEALRMAEAEYRKAVTPGPRP